MKNENAAAEGTSQAIQFSTDPIGPARLWHLITCEYPPQTGGVSDYTRLIAEQLALSGDEVHVWCPRTSGSPALAGVTPHDTLGSAGLMSLLRLGKRLNAFVGSRHLLVQWVPHGYGFRSMNLPFCLWLWGRAAWHGDRVEIMIHEPYLAFGEGSWQQDAVALVHRVMTVILLSSASKVWVAIPAWEARWRPYMIGRKKTFEWLPVVSNIPVCSDSSTVAEIRQRYLSKRRFLLGHFGLHGSLTTRPLAEVLTSLLPSLDATMLLIGKDSEEFRDKLLARTPQLIGRVEAAGTLEAADLSHHLLACDLLLQPYPDGISTRRGSAMAALAHGVPMVTTLGHLTEAFWRECDAIVAVPAGDAAAFVNAARRLLDDDPKRNRMSVRARSLYNERFDIRHVIGALRRKSGVG